MTILGRSEELVSRCIECDLAEPESLASLGGSAPGVVDGILSVQKFQRKRDHIVSAVKQRYAKRSHKFGIEVPRTVKQALD